MAMDGFHSFKLVWEERQIEVAYQRNWLNTGHLHLELRCDQRLPVTQTGYRSEFFPDGTFTSEAKLRDYVIAWLSEVADRPEWQRYLDISRQLDLF